MHSPKHLINCCTKIIFRNPVFINSKRIKRIARLKGKGLKASQIAKKVGVSPVFDLWALFKSTVHCKTGIVYEHVRNAGFRYYSVHKAGDILPFGKITGQNGNPRWWQLSLRLSF
jgi:hypothetical protein